MLRRGLDVQVRVSCLVDVDGQVREVRILDSQPRIRAFEEATREALERWRFEPWTLGEEVVSRRFETEFEFSVADDETCARTGSRLNRC